MNAAFTLPAPHGDSTRWRDNLQNERDKTSKWSDRESSESGADILNDVSSSASSAVCGTDSEDVRLKKKPKQVLTFSISDSSDPAARFLVRERNHVVRVDSHGRRLAWLHIDPRGPTVISRPAFHSIVLQQGVAWETLERHRDVPIFYPETPDKIGNRPIVRATRVFVLTECAPSEDYILAIDPQAHSSQYCYLRFWLALSEGWLITSTFNSLIPEQYRREKSIDSETFIWFTALLVHSSCNKSPSVRIDFVTSDSAVRCDAVTGSSAYCWITIIEEGIIREQVGEPLPLNDTRNIPQ